MRAVEFSVLIVKIRWFGRLNRKLRILFSVIHLVFLDVTAKAVWVVRLLALTVSFLLAMEALQGNI